MSMTEAVHAIIADLGTNPPTTLPNARERLQGLRRAARLHRRESGPPMRTSKPILSEVSVRAEATAVIIP